MTVNYLIWTFIRPSQLILIAAVLGVALWPTRVGRWCRAAAAVLIVVCGLLPSAAWLLRPLETRFAIPEISGEVDGVIVLAGSEQPTQSALYGQPQLGSMGDRLTTFLMLATRFPRARLVHSGASGSSAARALLLGAGIVPDRIVFEDRSGNTCESATAVHGLVGPAPTERWLLVTSAFHLPRAVACFRAAGWDVVPYPADYRRGPSALSFGLMDNLEDLDLAAHEWLGLVYYRLRGYTRELLPAPDYDRGMSNESRP